MSYIKIKIVGVEFKSQQLTNKKVIRFMYASCFYKLFPAISKILVDIILNIIMSNKKIRCRHEIKTFGICTSNII